MFGWVLLLGLVLTTCITTLLWKADLSLLGISTLVPILLFIWLAIALHIRQKMRRHFFSLANVIESLRIGDYTLRITPQHTDSAWADVYRELNLLAQNYQEKRLHYVESDILMDKLLAEFDAPVFVFDRNSILKNINPRGCELFSKSKHDMLGMNVQQMHVSRLVDSESGTVLDHWFPNRGGRWEIRKNFFLQEGTRYTLILVNDLSRTLREEERQAWVRLVRVLGHELNNSLASLSSVSQSLRTQLRDEKTDKWYERYDKALKLIDDRSTSLLRFTEAYTRLAKLPPPDKQEVDIKALFERLRVLVQGHFVFTNNDTVLLQADTDQLQQLAINLMKNAVEASDQNAQIDINWQEFQQGVRIQVIDKGRGLPSSDNLFVPFYTTKPDGSGIGLFLSRQIAEAHNGTLQLRNREDQTGCIAEVWLPQIAQ